MGLNTVKLPAFNAVGLGQTATLDVPLGPTYHAIYILYRESGTLAAEADLKAGVNDIRVKIAGKAQRTHSATQIISMLNLYGQNFRAGTIPLMFAEPWRRTPAGEDALAWGTADVPTFQIEVDIDALATAPTLEAYAVISRVSRPLGPIKRVRRYSIGVTSTGDRQVQNLPKVGTSYNAMHMFEGTAGDITNVLVEVDQNKVWDVPAALASKLYLDNGLAMQSGVHSVVFDFDSRVSSPLPMVRGVGGSAQPVSDFLVTATMGAANDFTIVTEETGLRF